MTCIPLTRSEYIITYTVYVCRDLLTPRACTSLVGASLSEPHTRELGGEISVCLYVCMYVCMYPSDFARELEVKCSRGHVRITADSKSRSHRFDTGK